VLLDRCPVCPSVCNVGVLWPNDWMDQDATWFRGRPRPGDIVLDGYPAPPPPGLWSPTFRPMSIVAKRSPISATAELVYTCILMDFGSRPGFCLTWYTLPFCYCPGCCFVSCFDVIIVITRISCCTIVKVHDPCLIMVALCNRADHYIFMLWFVLLSFFLLFFPRLISAAADWMSAILPHMVWP